jgi:hypothetical protein
VDELPRERDAAGLGDGNRRRAEVLATQTPELTFAHAQAAGQGIDAPLVESAELD